MADQTDHANTPLLTVTPNESSHSNHQYQQDQESQNPTQEPQDTELDLVLEKLETFLSFLGFNQSSVLKIVVSWASFLVVGVLVPVTILELTICYGCEKYQIKSFEMDILTSQAVLAAVSLACLSLNLRTYGIRKFLFVDRSSGRMSHLSQRYIQQIEVSICRLLVICLPLSDLFLFKRSVFYELCSAFIANLIWDLCRELELNAISALMD